MYFGSELLKIADFDPLHHHLESGEDVSGKVLETSCVFYKLYDFLQ